MKQGKRMEVKVRYRQGGRGRVEVEVEEYVPRHATRVEPPRWWRRRFSSMEEARAWAEDEDNLWTVIETETETERE